MQCTEFRSEITKTGPERLSQEVRSTSRSQLVRTETERFFRQLTQPLIQKYLYFHVFAFRVLGIHWLTF